MGMREEAEKILKKAYAVASYNPESTCTHEELIDYVIDNTHLTYKYVLFTALLSKATDEKINPLCLQKKSTLPGAYDARTICHKVIVPFEMEVLKKAMDGSNEPFLNKPARFPELSKTNAVRRGNDQNILNALCDNLPTIKTSQDAFDCLVYLLCKLIKSNFAKAFTFSITNALGRTFFITSRNVKINLLRLSSGSILPATENPWQGGPPKTKSTPEYLSSSLMTLLMSSLIILLS